MYRLLMGDVKYCETHNSLMDALDELKIMKSLGYRVDDYAIIS